MNSTEPSRRIDWPATGAVALTMLFWASVPVYLRYFTHHLDAWTANGFRYPLSALALAPVLFLGGRRTRPAPSIWRRALLPALFNTSGQILWATSPYYLDASLISFLVRMSILWSLVLSFIFFPRERVLAGSGRFWTGLLLAAGGFAGMTFLGPPIHGSTTGIGILLMGGCSLCFSLYSVSVRVKMSQDHPMAAFAVISLYTGSTLLVLMFLMGEPRRLLDLNGGQFVLLCLSSLTGIALGHSVYYFAIKRLGVLLPASGGLASPFLTALLAYVFLPGEFLTGGQWMAGMTACAGSALLLWSQDRLGRSSPSVERTVRSWRRRRIEAPAAEN